MRVELAEEVYRLCLGTGRAAQEGRAGEGELEIALTSTLTGAHRCGHTHLHTATLTDLDEVAGTRSPGQRLLPLSPSPLP